MSATPDIRSIGIIVIGNEVLSGKVRDENTPFLIDSFNRAGLRVGEVAIVADIVPRLAEVIRGFSARFDLVITTGGVGPTHDDCTWQAVAIALKKAGLSNQDVGGIPDVVTPAESATAGQKYGDKW